MSKYLCRIIDETDGPGPEREVEANDRWLAAEMFARDRNRYSGDTPEDGERIRVEVRNATGEPKPAIYQVMASHEINYYARAETTNDPHA